MKVIETIVTTVPREEISPIAEFFVQDWDDGLLCQYISEPYAGDVYWLGAGYGGSFGCQKISEDASKAIITREELMKAYDLVDQGYTLWFGGECPAYDAEVVDVVFRDAQRPVHSDVFYEVLYVGKEKAFIKDSDGTEYSFPLGELSKVIK